MKILAKLVQVLQCKPVFFNIFAGVTSNSTMKKTIFLILIICSFLGIRAENEYNITIHLNDYQENTLLLATWYGEKVFLSDSAYSENDKRFEFRGENPLPQGMYMVVSGTRQKLFEFLVGNDQQFKLSTDTSGYIQNMIVDGSEENNIFFNYVRRNSEKRNQERQLLEKQTLYKQNSNEFNALQVQIESIRKEAEAHAIHTINSNSGSFISVLLNAMREVQVPDKIEQNGDRTEIFNYYKKHYWDYLDLSDERLLRTPLLAQKVNQYLSNIVLFHPDSVIAAADLLINLARPSGDVVSWLVWHFISEYQNPDYMGFDKVFVHMVDEYILKEEIKNTTPSVAEQLKERADMLRPILLGKPAPDLILTDTSGAYFSFKSMTNEYLVIYFWDYDCGICSTETDHLREMMKNTNFDVGIYAVSINGDLEKWKKEIGIKKMDWINVNATRSVTPDYRTLYEAGSTPVIYLLDKNRNIIAKNIGADKVESFLENYTSSSRPQ
jgi:hypothetical protein